MPLPHRLLALAPLAALTAIALSAAHAPAEVVVFRFTGVITQIADYAGAPRTLGPIAIGNTFTGTFQYEVNQAPTATGGGFARYTGPCNSFRVTVNGLDFYSTPNDISFLGLSSFGYEGISAGTWDITVPPGWSINHSSGSDTYLVILQNPNIGILPNLNPPSTINLAQWTSSHEMRMDFFDGVTFPGGSYPDRTTVYGNIQTLTQLPSVTVTTNPTVSTFPSSVTFPAGQSATIPMSVTGIGPGTPTFQWRRNGSLIPSSPRIHVAPTGALTIDNVTSADMGVYDCVVDYGCGIMILGPAALGVSASSACPADFDRDGHIAIPDVFAFLNAWFAGCP